jgi:AraC-like DNA-binding protein
MDFQFFQPGLPLSRYVESFWLHREAVRSCVRDRGLPTGAAQLIIDLSGNGLWVPHHVTASRSHDSVSALFNGADTIYNLSGADSPVDRMGVDFKPGGAYPFMGRPAGELRDAHLPLETLWGIRAVDEVRERLIGAQTQAERWQILEAALLAHLARPLHHHPAVTLALRAFAAPCGPVIAHVVDQLALSHTRFIDVFRDEVGMSPKQYCRVRRFRRVLLHTWKEPRVHWALVARECGYSDQAHLTRDFQRFAGVTPGVFLRDRDAHFPMYLTLPTVDTAAEGPASLTALTR